MRQSAAPASVGNSARSAGDVPQGVVGPVEDDHQARHTVEVGAALQLGGEDARLDTALSAVTQAIKQSPANEVCYVAPAEDLPSGQTPTAKTSSSPSPDPATRTSPY
ncbi:hypothetical protein [Streptomyces caniscabiei]|uniref:hypothetical protein n=1 Tax=Streptomyces caniscabiei TaxID=2746961 RepID=UPI000AA34A13|nr:hypothetical protein [Streptomyces caniscabiei]